MGLSSLLRRCTVALALFLTFSLLTGWAGLATAQSSSPPPVPTAPIQITDPQQFRALEQPSNPLSFQRAEQLIEQGNAALQAQKYDQAVELLKAAFDAYNQRSNFHQQLGRSFAGIQNQISEGQRTLARDAAEKRDQTAYELAVVYRAANKPEEAVSQLVQVIGSQGPTRELGRKAYQQLLEIGFVDTPFS